jgi:asparaginyl-tRNA synthetase
MKQSPNCSENKETVTAFDLLLPEVCEVVGGSQRVDQADELERALDEAKLPREHYEWYLDLRRFGSVPHAGFGLGFDRYILYATGLQNIRDVVPFPRATGNLLL